MSRTPIIDFINEYNRSGTVRLHIPGHKGRDLTGAEMLDITEIKGADSLFEADGVIAESERNMSALYGSARTVYSTEGSSLSIRAMLAAAREYKGELKVAAARGCHKAFLDSCILLGLDPVWIRPEGETKGICSAKVTAEDVRRVLDEAPEINAVYLTSPDYYGNMADIPGISRVCHSRGALLLVDNAHGAYLKFAGSQHPLDNGADICCDSAHKTLPALTGTSLLHISASAPKELAACAKEAMALFASTSPSYVLLCSLDRCVSELERDYAQRVREMCAELEIIKEQLSAAGWELIGDEPMKLTVSALAKGLSGRDTAEELRRRGIEPEYADELCCVMMPTPCLAAGELQRTASALTDIIRSAEGNAPAEPLPPLPRPEKALSPREAYMRPHRRIPIDEAAGRICARGALSCQPSVPIIVGGEIFDEETVKILKRYSFFEADVVE